MFQGAVIGMLPVQVAHILQEGLGSEIMERKGCCYYEPWAKGETIREWADTVEKCPKQEGGEANAFAIIIGGNDLSC